MTSHTAAPAKTPTADEIGAADMRAVSAARLDAGQLASMPARSVVAASGGAVTTSREPLGEWARNTDNKHPAAEAADVPKAPRKPNTSPAKAAKPAAAARFAAVSMSTRIPEMAKWIAARPSFTFAEAAAANAPSPCSLTVMAYTLPDARLASALAELGYLMTAGGKNGYTVTAVKAPAKPDAARTPRAARPRPQAAARPGSPHRPEEPAHASVAGLPGGDAEHQVSRSWC
jgi:hypothetical protein